MNKALTIISILFTYTLIAQSNPTLIEIPHEVFVNGGRTDFDEIIYKEDGIKEQVKSLHEYDEFGHELSVHTHTFEQYWEYFKDQWHYIKFKDDATPLLLFTGKIEEGNDLEYIELYNPERIKGDRNIFGDSGRILAYKKHPYTGEVVLYTHKYPCCKSASHNIFRIRQVKDRVNVKDRFFAGRDAGDMVGPFFPETASFDKTYHKLDKLTELRWSPEVVEKDAFRGWSESNLIIHYDEGALYKVLYEEKGWSFVVFFSGIVEEQSLILSYTNFRNKGVYGWIKN